MFASLRISSSDRAGRPVATPARNSRFRALPFVLAALAGGETAGAAIAPVSGQVQVNTYTTLVQSKPDVAVWLDGTAVVVWQSAASGGGDTLNSIQAQVLDASGGLVGSQFQVNTYTTGDQVRPAVAMSSEGRFLVVWEGPGDANGLSIRGRVFEEDGTPHGAEFLVNDYQTGNQNEPDVAALPGGGFVVAWQSFGSPGGDQALGSIQARRFDVGGSPVANQIQVNTTGTWNQLEAAVDVDWRTGSWATAWRSYVVGGGANGNIMRAQRFGATGAPVGGEILVRTIPEAQAIEQPGLAYRPDGGFLVTWDEDTGVVDPFPIDVEAQRVGNDGLLAGSLLTVPDLNDKDQRLAGIASLSLGGFLATWNTDDHAGNDPTRSIAAIALDVDGAPAGSEIQVNSFVDNIQESPAVAVSPGGVGWIVWESNGSAGSDQSLLSIQAQRFADNAPASIFYDGFGSGDPSAWSLGP